MNAHSGEALEVSIIDDSRDFGVMEKEWDGLYRDAPLATPFQSWAWLYSWWESYGEDYELRLIAIRDADLLVGLIPLMLQRRWGFGRLLFIGTPQTDYLDILARQGWESQVSNAAIRALQQVGSWHVVDLQDLRPAAAAWSIFRNWNGPRIHTWQDSCPVIDVKPWDELLASLSKNLRSTIRRSLRRAETDGLRRELVDPVDVERAAHRWIALHREAWWGRDIASQNLTRRFESHLETAALRMTSCGLGAISEFRQDGEVIISQFWVFGRDFVGFYLFGASQEALRRYQVSSLYVWDGVNIARDRNIACLDLLRGEESYKLRWNPRIVPNYRVILGRSLVFWLPYASYRVLRLKGKRYAGSESTPQWIRSILNRLRGT